jgi:hypothetical protein
LVSTILTPVGARRDLRCEERSVLVEAASAAANPPAASTPPRDSRLEAARRSLPAAGVLVAIAIIIAIAGPRVQRAMRIRRETRSLLRETPSETRVAVDTWLVAAGTEPALLIREQSDRGDAYRALHSLLEAAERDRLTAEPAEIGARVRDVVVARSNALRSNT